MDDGSEEWISITVAAEKLTAAGDVVDRSTLSRYLSQHSEAIATKPDGKSKLVEYNALAAHRAENVRLRKAVPASPGLPLAAKPQRSFPGSQSDGVARKANADAAMREMDLAQRRRELTLVSEVDKAGREAVALMKSAFDRAVDGEAASASLKYGWDERIVRIVLKEFVRKGTSEFHDDVLKYLDRLERERVLPSSVASRAAVSMFGIHCRGGMDGKSKPIDTGQSASASLARTRTAD
ncbi:hypothetical protein [Tardiphaga sp. 841_E9_N1_2]|uniref:hypothetical protein n=1 Tax=Tardiphaga sp. 841_E9_N1_2 TaxID=3240762 RepID=UPI003F27888B